MGQLQPSNGSFNNDYHETQMRPVVDKVSVGVDGVGLRQVFLDQPHNGGHLKLRLVHNVGDAVTVDTNCRRRRRRHERGIVSVDVRR